jgi:hypothetical protein
MPGRPLNVRPDLRLKALRTVSGDTTALKRMRHLVSLMQAPGTQFDLACLADERVATALVAGLEERAVSGSMRYEVHTAYLQLRCPWAPVSDTVIALLMDSRQVAAADRKKESQRSQRRTIAELLALGRWWLLMPQHKELASALMALMGAAVRHPPQSGKAILQFARVLMTWMVTCQNHPTPRVQVAHSTDMHTGRQATTTCPMVLQAGMLIGHHVHDGGPPDL